jgi:hypothetical protein
MPTARGGRAIQPGSRTRPRVFPGRLLEDYWLRLDGSRRDGVGRSREACESDDAGSRASDLPHHLHGRRLCDLVAFLRAIGASFSPWRMAEKRRRLAK